MKRRDFMMLLAGAASWSLLRPIAGRAQTLAASAAPAGGQIGQVATLQGTATVKRAGAAAAVLKVKDAIFKNDVLETDANAALGVTFDDESTFSLSANTRLVVDEFVYQEGGSSNAALLIVARGTVAFVATLVAKTGDMKIATPTATLGIRGTTGVVEVPEPGAQGGAAAPPAGESRIKLYPDADGHVGQIEVFDRQGGRLGALTQSASAFAIRPGAGGRMQAVAFRIPPQEFARDRGALQRLFVSHTIGRRMAIERRRSRGRGPQRPNNLRQPGRRQPFRNLRSPGGRPRFQPRRPRWPGGRR